MGTFFENRTYNEFDLRLFRVVFEKLNGSFDCATHWGCENHLEIDLVYVLASTFALGSSNVIDARINKVSIGLEFTEFFTFKAELFDTFLMFDIEMSCCVSNEENCGLLKII